MRVIKALYRDSVPQIEQREETRRYETSKDLTNKIKLDGVSETNEELKALIRRLNEEVSILKAENSLLNE